MSYNNLAIAFQRRLASENSKRVNSAKSALLDEINRCAGYMQTVDLDKLISLVNTYQRAKSDYDANLFEIIRLRGLEVEE